MILNFIAPRRGFPLAREAPRNLRDEGDRARDNRQWGEAAKLYRSYLQRKPTDFEIWVQRGHAEKESGDFAAALQCYLKGQALRSDDPDLHLQLGHLYKLMDRQADAIASYQKCLEINADSDDAMRELAGLLRKAEAPETFELAEAPPAEFAAPAFEIPSHALNSDNELRARIVAEQEKGDLLAVALLTRAHVRLYPGEPLRWRALANALEQIGDESQAKRCRAIAAAM
jgi:tetratricopeptide (TPR) repeat protein